MKAQLEILLKSVLLRSQHRRGEAVRRSTQNLEFCLGKLYFVSTLETIFSKRLHVMYIKTIQ